MRNKGIIAIEIDMIYNLLIFIVVKGTFLQKVGKNIHLKGMWKKRL